MKYEFGGDENGHRVGNGKCYPFRRPPYYIIFYNIHKGTTYATASEWNDAVIITLLHGTYKPRSRIT